MPTNRVLIAFMLILVTGSISRAEDEEETPKLAAALSAEVDGKLLAGFPILFKLTISNRGKSPIRYWCGGPGLYPNASPFEASLTDRMGMVQSLSLHNGQFVMGSGMTYKIDPVQSLPAVCDPVVAGDYTLQIIGHSRGYYGDGTKKIETCPAMKSEAFKISIVDDPVALVAAERELLDRAKADPFASHVGVHYGIDPIVKSWLKQLLSDNSEFAKGATGKLQLVRRLPTGGNAMLVEAAKKHSRAKDGVPDKNLLSSILFIARRTHTDQSVEAIVTIATSEADLDTRRFAVRELRSLSGECAEQALLKLARDQESPIYWECVSSLSGRNHRAALDPLLQITKDESPDWRAYALLSLTGLRDDPQARAALEAALKDDDKGVRDCAKRALEWKTPDLYLNW